MQNKDAKCHFIPPPETTAMNWHVPFWALIIYIYIYISLYKIVVFKMLE